VTDYDSRPETYEHISKVRAELLTIASDLISRAHVHDQSKLENPELAIFDEYTPKLEDAEYGTPEYKAILQEMLKKGFGHHYEVNDHHPEHFSHGIADMNLMQITEMLCDWYAAGQRPGGISIRTSIEKNQKRFDYSDEMKKLLLNTAGDMGWL
jgi:cytosine/adenosine deaminase-related metal-dependent hydrolase